MSHRFVSWIRSGMAGARTSPTVAGANPTVKASVSIDGTARDVTVTLHGPGDIVGLAASSIVRRDPAPNSIGVSPNGIPFVELTPADLPWRFSPAPTNTASTSMLPWIALVVVPASVPFGPKGKALLPVLSVPRAELPDPAELSAWAHVQIEEPEGGLGTTPIGAYIKEHGDRAVARLLAPRRLAPQAKYRACIVPVYEAGRQAGLGEDDKIAAAGEQLAWGTAAATDVIDLPVYDAWLIETGAAADFETIARRMHGEDADARFVPMTIDVAAAAGSNEPLLATMFGVLRPFRGETKLPEAKKIASTLEPWLVTDDEPMIGPPLYGAAQAAASLANAEKWQSTLNLDPRRRAHAAAGAAIVREDQEQLVADARAAIGQLDRANAIVRGAQLATLLATRLHERHVVPRPPSRIVAMLWPTLASTEVAGALAPQPAAASLVSAAMRRMARPAGPIKRGSVAANALRGNALARLDRDVTLAIKPVPLDPTTTVTASAVRAAPPTPPPTPTPTTTHGPIRVAIGRFDVATLDAAALAGTRATIAARLATPMRFVTPPAAAPLDIDAIAKRALAAARPVTIAQRLAGRIAGLSQVATLVDLTEVKPALDLSRPLADRLARLHPTLFAPGLTDLPPDSAAVLTVDPEAVEAVLAGANDELMRELAWRGITVDRKLTLLRQMWPRPARDQSQHDVSPIAEWRGELGTHTTIAPTVFVIRSEIVRRFPTAVYGMAQAVVDPKYGRIVGEHHVLPLFRGLAAPDIAYIGFAESVATLAGDPTWEPGATTDPGWYLTIQERPGHTRFGLDAAKSDDPPKWENLSWDEVISAGARPFIQLGTRLTRYDGLTPKWAAGAASMAAITERPAVRIAIHVQELLAHG